MDQYMHDLRAHLKLSEASARHRLRVLEDRPKGMVLRTNQIKHTLALLTLLIEIRVIASHDPEKWYDDDHEVPF